MSIKCALRGKGYGELSQKAAALIEQQQSEISRLNARVAQLEKYLKKMANGELRHGIENGGQCNHEIYWYEQCEDCYVDFAY